MATKPATVPRWAEEAGGTQHNISEPASGFKDDGWKLNQLVPPGWMNWWKNLVYRWILYLRDAVFTGESGQPGITATGGTGNAAGGVLTGSGTGNGATITGGATGKGAVIAAGGGNNAGVESTGAGTGNGVTATGGASGHGGVFTGGATVGKGLRAIGGGASAAAEFVATAGVEVIKVDASGGTGVGILCTPNSTRAPINYGSLSADPSTLVDGDSWYNSTAGKFRGRANGVTVDFH